MLDGQQEHTPSSQHDTPFKLIHFIVKVWADEGV